MGLKGALLLFGAAAIGLVIFATLYQYALEYRARTWIRTRGRILSTRVVARRVRKPGHQGDEMRNFPDIAYEYEVGGNMRRGKRIRLGEDIGNTDVATKVAQYPKGAPVTVYYDPANPQEAVLEREAPAGVYRTMAIFIAGCIAFWLTVAFGTELLTEAIASAIPRPGNVWAVALFGGFGLFTGLLAMAMAREFEATKAWQPTWGRIDSASVETFRMLSWGGHRRWSWFFYPLIVYSYSVGGHRYTSSRLALGGRLMASVDLFARRQAAATARAIRSRCSTIPPIRSWRCCTDAPAGSDGCGWPRAPCLRWRRERQGSCSRWNGTQLTASTQRLHLRPAMEHPAVRLQTVRGAARTCDQGPDAQVMNDFSSRQKHENAERRL